MDKAKASGSGATLFILIVICALILAHGINKQPAQHTKPAVLPSNPPITHYSSYRDLARQDAVAVGIDPDLFERQINDESGFNPDVVSPAGAIGIAQFMPDTASGMGVNPHDPVSALWGAARLMASYVRRFGSYDLAAAAYNAGPNATQAALNRCGSTWLTCLPHETQNYVAYIMQK
jgi:soluble lytic murein transglycosylase-like protein